MSMAETIERACTEAGIRPPRSWREGQWAKTDTLDGGSHGKGDGRLLVNGDVAVAWNWRTGVKAVLRLDGAGAGGHNPAIVRKQREDAARQRAEKATRAAAIARQMLAQAKPETHSYLGGKGFLAEAIPVLGAKAIAALGGRYDDAGRFQAADYLVAGQRAIVMAARIGATVASVQLIWEDGTKKFLAGSTVDGASHRVAAGRGVTWLCEGLATGLSLRLALRGLKRADTVLCCFSANNLPSVARELPGRVYIAADNDKPQPQFGGRGTGEHWARASGRQYLMPPTPGHDLNDMYQTEGIFEVQSLLTRFLREARL